MYVHGGYLSRGIYGLNVCVVGPKDMVGHGNGVWGDTYNPDGKVSGVLCV